MRLCACDERWTPVVLACIVTRTYSLTAPRYESPHPPGDRKGFTDWQSLAPAQRNRPAATVVYFCTAVCIPPRASSSPYFPQTLTKFSRLGMSTPARLSAFMTASLSMSSLRCRM